MEKENTMKANRLLNADFVKKQKYGTILSKSPARRVLTFHTSRLVPSTSQADTIQRECAWRRAVAAHDDVIVAADADASRLVRRTNVSKRRAYVGEMMLFDRPTKQVAALRVRRLNLRPKVSSR